MHCLDIKVQLRVELEQHLKNNGTVLCFKPIVNNLWYLGVGKSMELF